MEKGSHCCAWTLVQSASKKNPQDGLQRPVIGIVDTPFIKPAKQARTVKGIHAQMLRQFQPTTFGAEIRTPLRVSGNGSASECRFNPGAKVFDKDIQEMMPLLSETCVAHAPQVQLTGLCQHSHQQAARFFVAVVIMIDFWKYFDRQQGSPEHPAKLTQFQRVMTPFQKSSRETGFQFLNALRFRLADTFGLTNAD